MSYIVGVRFLLVSYSASVLMLDVKTFKVGGRRLVLR